MSSYYLLKQQHNQKTLSRTGLQLKPSFQTTKIRFRHRAMKQLFRVKVSALNVNNVSLYYNQVSSELTARIRVKHAIAIVAPIIAARVL